MDLPAAPSATPASPERRHFLQTTAAAALGALGAAPNALSAALPVKKAAPPESLVKVLFESLSKQQRRAICFPWNYVDSERGLLRTHIANNWRITRPTVAGNFYSRDQQALIRGIFEGMTSPDWHERFDQQLKDDVGGFGRQQSIAIFGEPGTGEFQFVLTSRHMTLRCDGDSADHVAFGGPILYAHEGERLYEKPNHPNNVFWHQAVEANKLFQTLSRSQRKEALVTHGMPSEEQVGFKGQKGPFQGCPVSDFTDDQRREVQRILRILLEPFRQSDRDEVARCLGAQGGLDGCHLAFYKEGDLGEDRIYDNWRLEGPSFVWYFRGRPHVHVWVNVADDPSVKLNSSQDSVGV